MQSVVFRPRQMLALLSLVSAHAYAVQVLGVHVTREHERFVMGMHIVIDAPSSKVFRALRDYAAMPRYNPDLRAVSVQATLDPDRVRLATTVHTCVLFFCKTVHQEQVMTATANASGGILQADLVPRSDAFGGQGRWTVKPCRANPSPTCMDLEIELIPVFWVPPVIGSWLIRSKMEQEALRSSQGLEQMAQARGPGQPRPTGQ